MADMSALGTALVAGIFGLGGVAVAQVVAIRIDRRREKREDERRWHTERRSLYAAFLATAYGLFQVVRDKNRSEEESIQRGRDFILKLQELELIASPAVADAAQDLSMSLYRYRKNASSDEEKRSEANKVFASRDAFLRVARVELGVGDRGSGWSEGLSSESD